MGKKKKKKSKKNKEKKENYMKIEEVKDIKTERGIEAYCVKCREKRIMLNPEKGVMKNGKPMTQGICPECGTKMCRIGA